MSLLRIKVCPADSAASIPERIFCLIYRLMAKFVGMGPDGSRLFRRRRFAAFLQLVDAVIEQRGRCRILDVGGETRYWTGLGDLLGGREVEVVMVNPASSEPTDPRFSYAVGDARDLSCWPDMSFDIVHSNSVIEHVGLWSDMKDMAREVRRLAPTFYVQTPYYWFPLEPHSSTLFFHWLPEPVRLWLVMRKKRGYWSKAPDVQTGMALVHSAVLLDKRMMSALFPDAEIQCEHVLGLTKSLVALRRGGAMRQSVGEVLTEAVLV